VASDPARLSLTEQRSLEPEPLANQRGRTSSATWPVGRRKDRHQSVGLLKSLSANTRRIHETFKADAWIIGRVSMEPYAGKNNRASAVGPEHSGRKDFIADRIPVVCRRDRSTGKLAGNRTRSTTPNVITILSQAVSDDYLAFLQSRAVSFLFRGQDRIVLRGCSSSCANSSPPETAARGWCRINDRSCLRT